MVQIFVCLAQSKRINMIGSCLCQTVKPSGKNSGEAPSKGRFPQRRSRRFSSQFAEGFQLSVHRKQVMF
jgi:hypothetical protein